MAHVRILFAALILVCISLASAHDLLPTTTAVCVNGTEGYGPYISWSLKNDWSTAATLTLSVVTSLGPTGTKVNFGPVSGASATVSGILMPYNGGTTTIKGTVVWADERPYTQTYSKDTTKSSPTGCVKCAALNQLCGTQPSTFCLAMACDASDRCGLTQLTTDTRCNKKGKADSQPICTQQQCASGTCVSIAFDDPMCNKKGQAQGLPICMQEQCADKQCVSNAAYADPACAKMGERDGLPICTRQTCIGTQCADGQPYLDPACGAKSLPVGLAPECNRMECMGATCQAVPWFGNPNGIPPTEFNTPCVGPRGASTCNRWVCMYNATSQLGYCGVQADPSVTVCDDDQNLCTAQKCATNLNTGVASCSVATTTQCLDAAAPAECTLPSQCDPTTGKCGNPVAPDNTNCMSDLIGDANCTNYVCFNGECVRNCLCGNGILDESETCDWGADAWCPIPPHKYDHCPEGLQPGNEGLGNHKGLNDSVSWCNSTCTSVHASRRATGMSKGAVAGVAVASVLGALLLAAIAIGLFVRSSAASKVAQNFATSDNAGHAHNNPTFSSPGLSASNPNYVQLGDT